MSDSFRFSHPSVEGDTTPGQSSRSKRLGAFVLGLALLLEAAAASAGTADLSLAEAVSLAVARSPQIGAQRSMIGAAREMAGPARELPDPKLKLGVENVPTEGVEAWSLRSDSMTMSKIGVMQEFPREEKRQLKSARAQREADRAAAALDVTALAVRREAAAAWFARRYAADAERIVAEQRAEAELAVTTALAAYRAGKGTQAEVITAQAAAVDLANRATEAALASKRAQITLARYIGNDSDRPPGAAPDVAHLPFDADQLSAPDVQPELRLARAQEAAAATDADIARASKLPDWSAELSYAVRGPTYANMVSLMFAIDLPWSPGTRQEREYAARLKELDAARQMREDAQRMRTAEVDAMRAEWEAAREQVARLREKMLPLTAQRRDAALASYRGGTGTLAAVLDARRSELDVQLALLQQEQAAAKAWAWLSFITITPEAS